MKPYAENRKIYFNYEVLETFESGIELLGIEVTSIRKGRIQLDGSYITLNHQEAHLVGATIQSFQPKNTDESYEPMRPRKLLLHKDELKKLESSSHEKGLTIVPLSVYNKGRKIKLQIAIARGKKLHDKRETIKRRDAEREIRRTLKNE